MNDQIDRPLPGPPGKPGYQSVLADLAHSERPGLTDDSILAQKVD
jgi:hypothetical protein